MSDGHSDLKKSTLKHARMMAVTPEKVSPVAPTQPMDAVQQYHPYDIVTGACSVCTKQFELTRECKDKSRALFCNIECCRTKWNRTHVIRICENCNVEFERPQSVKQTRFCCWKCYRENIQPQSHGNYIGTFGFFQSSKAGNVHFDSRLELNRMKELDADASILKWERSKYQIPWVDVNGKARTYFPDFDLTMLDGSVCVEEMKGYFDLASQMKIDAAKAYFSSLSISYRVLSLRDIQPNVEAYEQYDNDFGTYVRPTRISTFMSMARIFRDCSTCLRRQVGAVFTDPEMTRVLCLGYNGGVKGDQNQCESLKPGQCGCIHAEVNAMMKANESLKGSTLFTTTAPCKNCAKLLINCGVGRVYYDSSYRDKSGTLLLQKHKIDVIRWEDYVRKCDDVFVGHQFKACNTKPIDELLKIEDTPCCDVIMPILIAGTK